MGDRDAAHVDEVVRAAVVADVELAVGTELRAVRSTARLGDRLLVALGVHARDPLALDLTDRNGAVRQYDRPLWELEPFREHAHLSHRSPPPRPRSRSGRIPPPHGRGT